MRTNSLTSTTNSGEDMPGDVEEKYTKNGRLSWSDRLSILVLLVLYTLQGIPMGLSGSIPMILKDKGVSYEALSLFSLVSLPFSMKIIWAPFVDSYYVASFGRRKTWLVPVQLLTGLMMICGASYIQLWLREGEDSVVAEPDTLTLTAYFFALYFLMATQDIAVDGWALTMLSRESVGLASACNVFGQSLGVFLANQGLIALSDGDWCVKYLGSDGAVVTLPSFMVWWGWVFIVTTAVVCVFKREEVAPTEAGGAASLRNDAEKEAFQAQLSSSSQAIGAEAELPGLRETVRQIALLCQLPSVTSFLFVLFTARVGVAVVDGAFSFKLQEYGLRKTTLATMSPAVLLVSFVAPVLTGQRVAREPLRWYFRGMVARLVLAALLWLLLQYTAYVYVYSAPADNVSDTPLYYLTLLCLVLNEAASSLVFLSLMSFFNQVSDPSIGGSYMTLLNTAANLGSKWPSVLALYLLPKLTVSPCVSSAGHVASCRGLTDAHCDEAGGVCRMSLDGYTVLTALCLCAGALWLRQNQARLATLQSLPHSDWLVATAERRLQPQTPGGADGGGSSGTADTGGGSGNGSSGGKRD